MKKFLILHFGFEMPTPEDMAGWNNWFASIAERQVERGHLPGGKEISDTGVTDLPFGKESLTGYTMIEAADLDEATAIAKECPYVLSTRVYEVKS